MSNKLYPLLISKYVFTKMYKYTKFSLIRIVKKYDYCKENINETLLPFTSVAK